MSGKGFIVIDRAIDEWRWRDNSVALGLWLHILLSANWRSGWFSGHEIPRGSFATSMRRMAEDTGLSEKTIRKWLKRFEEDQQIELRGMNRFTIIKVINYAKYQDYIADNETERSELRSELRYEQRSELRLDNRTNKQINKETIRERHREKADHPADIPTLEDVLNYVAAHSKKVDGSRFFNYYNARGWKIKGDQVTDWKSLLDSWEDKDRLDTASGKKKNQTVPDYMIQDYTDPDDGGKPSDGELEELKALMERLR